MERDPIYLDHNATTPLLPEVVEAMLPYLREHFGNPSSGHVFGLRARRAVDEARARVAALIGAEPDEIVFTSGGTEANNLALRGVLEATPQRRNVVTTVIEHPATVQPCAWLEAQGHRITRLPVDAEGQARVDAADFGPDTALLSVMHANNETGVLQPVAALAAAARAAGARVHTDAAQSLGKVPV
ncbi:MAG: aminotransferase class V-fold PLP-dependent enzyme, partial [Myxococcales bacterium]|nr:aminotransferase class V-fold PLP-dependent enzyme [Myxococcales bacterium]